MVKDQLLVVLGILEGRKFPKRPRHQIVVEAKFDGELLSTDPVDHTETPDLNTELAWELNKKSLHQHRLQRTPIKLQCYAVDTLTSAKEAVGYVILDIRQAKQDDPTPSPRWHSLLSSKYSRYKPEIRASISIETDSADKKDTSFRAKDAPPRDDLDPRTLKAVLNEEEGYYQVGPADRCAQHFILSVTVAFASNLPQLVPMSMPLPSRDLGFFFYYSLLGNDVTNESFHNLLNPDFPAERASVRLRSSVQVLRLFLATQPGVQLHLCCGDQSLGSTEVPLNTLLKSATDLLDKPASVEGSFVLNPPNRVKQQLPSVGGDMAPSVGVSITLRQDTPSQPTAPPASPTKHPITPSQAPEPQASDKRPQTPPRKDQPPPPPQEHTPPPGHSPAQGHTPPQRLLPSPPASPSSDTQGTEQGLSSLGEEGSKEETREQGKSKTAASEHGKPARDPKAQEPTLPVPTQVPPVADSAPSSITTSQPFVSIPPAAHHFCFSLDLRSIQDVETSMSTPLYIFLRYTYPFFGSAAPILTHPPVEIRRNMEVLLPQSFCAFDFASTPQQLQDTLTRIPIMVEVWHKDKISQDALVGVARISLNTIIIAEKARFVNAQGVSGWRQSHSTRIPVLSVDGDLRKVGEVHVVMTLEDLGQVTTQQILIGSDASQSASVPVTVTQPPAALPAPPPVAPPPATPPPADPRETVEYQMAMELEMWKEQQENMFESQLKQKELQTMQALAEEWKRRDREREILVQKKLTEYQQLEEKLRTTLADLERREKQLTSGEAEVVRMKADLQRDQERTLTELREASRRLKEDCEHEVQLERAKVRELELHNQRLREQLQEAERRVQQKEHDFDEYRAQQAGKPEFKLQSEINLMTLEKVELERKLDYVAKSKLHYKQQWGRALKELARLKQREQTNAKARLKQQQQELEHMRLRYLAAEEKEIVKAEKQELETIKEELTRLKDQRIPEQPAPPSHAPDTRRASDGHMEHMQPLVPEEDTSMIDDHVTRLIEERDTLLRTGVYTHEDRIIAELDRQIREAIARKGGR